MIYLTCTKTAYCQCTIGLLLLTSYVSYNFGKLDIIKVPYSVKMSGHLISGFIKRDLICYRPVVPLLIHV